MKKLASKLFHWFQVACISIVFVIMFPVIILIILAEVAAEEEEAKYERGEL